VYYTFVGDAGDRPERLKEIKPKGLKESQIFRYYGVGYNLARSRLLNHYKHSRPYSPTTIYGSAT
jgi:hypothetical protein